MTKDTSPPTPRSAQDDDARRGAADKGTSGGDDEIDFEATNNAVTRCGSFDDMQSDWYNLPRTESPNYSATRSALASFTDRPSRNPLMSLLGEDAKHHSVSREMELLQKVSVLKRMLLSERQQRLAEQQKWARFLKDIADMRCHVETTLKTNGVEEREQHQHQKQPQRAITYAPQDSLSLPESSRGAPLSPVKGASTPLQRFFKGLVSSTPRPQQDQPVLKDEISALREENLALEERIADMQSILDAKTSILERTVAQTSQQQERAQHLEELNAELQLRLRNALHRLRQQERLHQTMQERMREMERTNASQAELLEQQIRSNEELSNELQAKNTTLENMARQLMEMKQQMNDLALMLRRFNVLHVGKGGKIIGEAQLLLQKNPQTGMLTLAVVSPSAKRSSAVFPLGYIEALRCDDKPGRFVLAFPNGKSSTFDATDEDEVDKIFRTLREFQRAQAETDEQSP